MKKLFLASLFALSSLSSFAAVCTSENSAVQTLWPKFKEIYSNTLKHTPQGYAVGNYLGDLQMKYYRSEVPSDVAVAVAKEAKAFETMVLGLYAQSSDYASLLDSTLKDLSNCIQTTRPACTADLFQFENHVNSSFFSLREIVDYGHYARHTYNKFVDVLNETVRNRQYFPEQASSDVMNGAARFYFSGRNGNAWLAEQSLIREKLDAELNNCLK